MKIISKVPYADPSMVGKPVRLHGIKIGVAVGIDKNKIVSEIDDKFKDEFSRSPGYSIAIKN